MWLLSCTILCFQLVVPSNLLESTLSNRWHSTPFFRSLILSLSLYRKITQLLLLCLSDLLIIQSPRQYSFQFLRGSRSYIPNRSPLLCLHSMLLYVHLHILLYINFFLSCSYYTFTCNTHLYYIYQYTLCKYPCCTGFQIEQGKMQPALSRRR